MLCASFRRLGHASVRSLLPMEALASGTLAQQAASAATDHTHHTYDVGKASALHCSLPHAVSMLHVCASWENRRARPQTTSSQAGEWTGKKKSSHAELWPAACLMLLILRTLCALSIPQATNIKFHDGMVPRENKEQLLGQKGVVLWFTGERDGGKQLAGSCNRFGLPAERHCNFFMQWHAAQGASCQP